MEESPRDNTQIVSIFNELKTFVKEVNTNLQDFTQVIRSEIFNRLQTNESNVNQAVQDLSQDIREQIISIQTDIQQKFQDNEFSNDQIIDAVSAISDQVEEIGDNTASGEDSNLSSMLESASRKIDESKTDIIRILESQNTDLMNIQRSISGLTTQSAELKKMQEQVTKPKAQDLFLGSALGPKGASYLQFAQGISLFPNINYQDISTSPLYAGLVNSLKGGRSGGSSFGNQFLGGAFDAGRNIYSNLGTDNFSGIRSNLGLGSNIYEPPSKGFAGIIPSIQSSIYDMQLLGGAGIGRLGPRGGQKYSESYSATDRIVNKGEQVFSSFIDNLLKNDSNNQLSIGESVDANRQKGKEAIINASADAMNTLFGIFTASTMGVPIDMKNVASKMRGVVGILDNVATVVKERVDGAEAPISGVQNFLSNTERRVQGFMGASQYDSTKDYAFDARGLQAILSKERTGDIDEKRKSLARDLGQFAYVGGYSKDQIGDLFGQISSNFYEMPSGTGLTRDQISNPQYASQMIGLASQTYDKTSNFRQFVMNSAMDILPDEMAQNLNIGLNGATLLNKVFQNSFLSQAGILGSAKGGLFGAAFEVGKAIFGKFQTAEKLKEELPKINAYKLIDKFMLDRYEDGEDIPDFETFFQTYAIARTELKDFADASQTPIEQVTKAFKELYNKKKDVSESLFEEEREKGKITTLDTLKNVLENNDLSTILDTFSTTQERKDFLDLLKKLELTGFAKIEETPFINERFERLKEKYTIIDEYSPDELMQYMQSQDMGNYDEARRNLNFFQTESDIEARKQRIDEIDPEYLANIDIEKQEEAIKNYEERFVENLLNNEENVKELKEKARQFREAESFQDVVLDYPNELTQNIAVGYDNNSNKMTYIDLDEQRKGFKYESLNQEIVAVDNLSDYASRVRETFIGSESDNALSILDQFEIVKNNTNLNDVLTRNYENILLDPEAVKTLGKLNNQDKELIKQGRFSELELNKELKKVLTEVRENELESLKNAYVNDVRKNIIEPAIQDVEDQISMFEIPPELPFYQSLNQEKIGVDNLLDYNARLSEFFGDDMSQNALALKESFQNLQSKDFNTLLKDNLEEIRNSDAYDELLDTLSVESKSLLKEGRIDELNLNDESKKILEEFKNEKLTNIAQSYSSEVKGNLLAPVIEEVTKQVRFSRIPEKVIPYQYLSDTKPNVGNLLEYANFVDEIFEDSVSDNAKNIKESFVNLQRKDLNILLKEDFEQIKNSDIYDQLLDTLSVKNKALLKEGRFDEITFDNKDGDESVRILEKHRRQELEKLKDDYVNDVKQNLIAPALGQSIQESMFPVLPKPISEVELLDRTKVNINNLLEYDTKVNEVFQEGVTEKGKLIKNSFENLKNLDLISFLQNNYKEIKNSDVYNQLLKVLTGPSKEGLMNDDLEAITLNNPAEQILQRFKNEKLTGLKDDYVGEVNEQMIQPALQKELKQSPLLNVTPYIRPDYNGQYLQMSEDIKSIFTNYQETGEIEPLTELLIGKGILSDDIRDKIDYLQTLKDVTDDNILEVMGDKYTEQVSQYLTPEEIMMMESGKYDQIENPALIAKLNELKDKDIVQISEGFDDYIKSKYQDLVNTTTDNYRLYQNYPELFPEFKQNQDYSDTQIQLSNIKENPESYNINPVILDSLGILTERMDVSDSDLQANELGIQFNGDDQIISNPLIQNLSTLNQKKRSEIEKEYKRLVVEIQNEFINFLANPKKEIQQRLSGFVEGIGKTMSNIVKSSSDDVENDDISLVEGSSVNLEGVEVLNPSSMTPGTNFRPSVSTSITPFGDDITPTPDTVNSNTIDESNSSNNVTAQSETSQSNDRVFMNRYFNELSQMININNKKLNEQMEQMNHLQAIIMRENNALRAELEQQIRLKNGL